MMEIIARSLGVFKLLTAAQFKAVLASPHLNTRYEEQVEQIWLLTQLMVKSALTGLRCCDRLCAG